MIGKRKYCLLLFLFYPFSLFSQSTNTGYVKIIFENIINDSPVVLHDKIYTNTWREQYSIDQLKYYISGISLDGAAPFTEGNDCLQDCLCKKFEHIFEKRCHVFQSNSNFFYYSIEVHV